MLLNCEAGALVGSQSRHQLEVEKHALLAHFQILYLLRSPYCLVRKAAKLSASLICMAKSVTLTKSFHLKLVPIPACNV